MPTEAERARAAAREEAAQSSRPADWDAKWEDSWRRPSGRVPIIAGMSLLLIGAAILFFGAVIPAGELNYAGQFEPNLAKWPMIWGGGGLFNVGLVLWCLGQVQKALWFLPGRETER